MRFRILSNISFNFRIRFITYAFSAITLFYIARVLQPSSFGRIFLRFIDIRLFHYGRRHGPSHLWDEVATPEPPKNLNKVFSELWSISFLLSLISTAALLLTVVLVPRPRGDMPLILIFGSGIIFQMIGCENGCTEGLRSSD